MALKDDRVEQCLRSCGSEFQNMGSKAREGAEAMSLAFVLLDFFSQEKLPTNIKNLYCWIFLIKRNSQQIHSLECGVGMSDSVSVEYTWNKNQNIFPSRAFCTDLKQNEAQSAHTESTHKGVN